MATDNDVVHLPLSYKGSKFYTAEIGVGTPPVFSPVLMDLGSTAFWLLSSECDVASCTGKATYNSDLSSTYIPNGTIFEMSYNSGTVYGFRSYDTVHVGDIPVMNQLLAQVTDPTAVPGFDTMPFDGIMGLGFGGPTNVVSKSMVKQDLLKPLPIFAFYLNFEGKEPQSQISFGGVDPTRYTGSITWFNVDTDSEFGPGHWNFKNNLNFWYIQGDDEKFEVSGSTLIDSGTVEALFGPKEMIDHLLNKIVEASEVVKLEFDYEDDVYGPKKQAYWVNCDLKDGPEMVLYFNEMNFTLTPEEYLMPGVQPNIDLCFINIGGFGGSEGGTDDYYYGENFPLVLGMGFLRKYYSVYDPKNLQMGFALANKGNYGVDPFCLWQTDCSGVMGGQPTIAGAKPCEPGTQCKSFLWWCTQMYYIVVLLGSI